MMNIVVYEPNKNIHTDLTAAAGEDFHIRTFFQNEDELIKALPVQKIDILIVNSAVITEAIRAAVKDCVPYIIVLAEASSIQTFKASLDIGARDLVTVPFDIPEMTQALRKAQHYLASQKMAAKAPGARNGKITVFMSSKGGVGKSMLATNTALMLQKESGAKVLLIDTVTRFGSTDILIDLSEKKSMGLISVSIDDYDSYWQEIEDNVISHGSGLHLLTAGDKSEEPLTIQKVRAVLTAVKDHYDHIIIDAESYFTDVNLGLLEMADTVFFVSTFDIAAIKNLNLGLETIRSLYFSTDKIKIVINQFDKNNELTIAELERYIKYKITNIIPFDRETVIKSINNGTPFVVDAPQSDIALAVKGLADCVAGKSCVLTVPEGGSAAASQNWLKSFVHIFGEK